MAASTKKAFKNLKLAYAWAFAIVSYLNYLQLRSGQQSGRHSSSELALSDLAQDCGKFFLGLLNEKPYPGAQSLEELGLMSLNILHSNPYTGMANRVICAICMCIHTNVSYIHPVVMLKDSCVLLCCAIGIPD